MWKSYWLRARRSRLPTQAYSGSAAHFIELYHRQLGFFSESQCFLSRGSLTLKKYIDTDRSWNFFLLVTSCKFRILPYLHFKRLWCAFKRVCRYKQIYSRGQTHRHSLGQTFTVAAQSRFNPIGRVVGTYSVERNIFSSSNLARALPTLARKWSKS